MFTRGFCKQLVAKHFWFGSRVYSSLSVSFLMLLFPIEGFNFNGLKGKPHDIGPPPLGPKKLYASLLLFTVRRIYLAFTTQRYQSVVTIHRKISVFSRWAIICASVGFQGQHNLFHSFQAFKVCMVLCLTWSDIIAQISKLASKPLNNAWPLLYQSVSLRLIKSNLKLQRRYPSLLRIEIDIFP